MRVQNATGTLVILFASFLFLSTNVFAADASGAVQPSQKYFIVSVDKDENIYRNNAPSLAGSELTNAIVAAGMPTIYIRGDKDVRFEAVARVFAAAENASIKKVVLGSPPNLGRTIPLTLSSAIEVNRVGPNDLSGGHSIEIRNLPVTIKGTAGGFGASGDVVVFLVDFDGTISWNRVAIDQPTLSATLQRLASKNSVTQICIFPNRLSKLDTVEKLIANAYDHGLHNVTLVFETN
jgi:biopolymer transport protein ExbD